MLSFSNASAWALLALVLAEVALLRCNALCLLKTLCISVMGGGVLYFPGMDEVERQWREVQVIGAGGLQLSMSSSAASSQIYI